MGKRSKPRRSRGRVRKVYRCRYCGRVIRNWRRLEEELRGCRFYCSLDCCYNHWLELGGSPRNAPRCPCF